MRKILFFESMLVPKIITGLYWFLLFVAIVGGVSSMFVGYQGFTVGKFILGLIYAGAGAVAARVWCELMIVLFKMNEALQEMRLIQKAAAKKQTEGPA